MKLIVKLLDLLIHALQLLIMSYELLDLLLLQRLKLKLIGQ